MYAARSGFDLLISGVLLGIGVSGTGITALVGRGRPRRAAREAHQRHRLARHGRRHRRLRRLPLHAPADGPVGWQTSLLVLLATTAIVLPLAWPLAGKPGGQRRPDRPADAGRRPSRRPSRIRAICCWSTGFFVCGFHVAFYAVHLPAFVADKGLDASVAVIGADHGRHRQPGRHLHRRPVGPLHREAPGAEPDLFRPLLRVPGAAVPADHADDRHRPQHRCSACSGCRRCR